MAVKIQGFNHQFVCIIGQTKDSSKQQQQQRQNSYNAAAATAGAQQQADPQTVSAAAVAPPVQAASSAAPGVGAPPPSSYAAGKSIDLSTLLHKPTTQSSINSQSQQSLLQVRVGTSESDADLFSNNISKTHGKQRNAHGLRTKLF